MNCEKQKNEALSRIQTLTKKFQLNPNIEKYFSDGRLYYSYLTAGGFMSSIDTISYDPTYEEAVQDFANSTGSLVYHAVETQTGFGKMLSLLYVGDDEGEWEEERLQPDDAIMSYTVNLDQPDFNEYGYIRLSSMGGALIRIG